MAGPHPFRAEPEPWRLVLPGAILMATTAAVWYSASVFFVAILREFQRDYAITSGIFAVFIIAYGVSGLLVGDLVDRFGCRRVILAGSALHALGLVADSFAGGIGFLYVSHGLLASFGMSAMGYVPVSVLLTRAFQRRRGLALGMASAGVGVGILVGVPLVQLLVARVGWRLAYASLGMLAFGVSFPVALLAIPPDRPHPAGHLQPSPASRSDLLSSIMSRSFWLVTATFALLNTPVQLVMTHQIAHLIERGQSPAFVAGLVGLIGLISIPAKITWGFLSDRWWIENIYLLGTGFLVLAIAGLMALSPALPVGAHYAYVALMGFGYALSPAMTPILTGRFFSGRHFGALFGAVNILYHLGGAAGVWAAGRVHDVTGEYSWALVGSILSALAAAACVWVAAPRRVLR
jgi:predicted MFS family arabinose efflux permease